MTTEEIAIFKKAKAGDRDAIWKILKAHEGHIHVVASRYYKPGVDFDDLMQCGRLGMMQAIEKFDTSRGFQFLTYASDWVHNYIRSKAKEYSSIMRIPPHVHERLNEIRKTRQFFKNVLDREPTIEEYSEGMYRSKRATQVYLDLRLNVESLDEILVNDDDDDSLSKYHPSVWINYEEKLIQLENMDVIGRALDSLDKRLSTILKYRFGMIGPTLTLEQVAKKMKVSRERIRQLEERAFEILRNKIERYEFMDRFSPETKSKNSATTIHDDRIVYIVKMRNGPKKKKSFKAIAKVLGIHRITTSRLYKEYMDALNQHTTTEAGRMGTPGMGLGNDPA